MAHKVATRKRKKKVQRKPGRWVAAFERVLFWLTRIGVAWLFVTSFAWVFLIRDLSLIVTAELVLVIVVLSVAAVVWRRKRLKVLADSGNADPGLVGLGKQYTDEKEKVAYIRQQFDLACKSKHLQDVRADENKATPTLRNIRMDGNGDIRFEIDCAEAGLTVEELQAKSYEIGQICKAHRCVIRKTKNIGSATVLLQKTDYLDRVPPYQEMPKPKRRGNAVLGVTETGAPMELHSHIPAIFAGGQGSGKSNLGRAKLLSLADQKIWTKLYIIDPKNQEFAEWGKHEVGEWFGTFCVAGYVGGDDEKAGLALLDEAYNELLARSEGFARDGITNAVDAGNSKDNPYILVINDEGLDYKEYEKKGSSIPYGRYKQKARAVGCQAITMFQYCLATELGAGRKLYGQRVCMRAEEETGVTVLGRDAVTRGAKVQRIPIDKPGLGYYVDESDQVTLFRGFLVPDPVWHQLAATGEVPEDMGAGLVAESEEPEVATYQFANTDSEVIYVGKARDVDERFKQHAADKPWWPEVDWKNPMTKVRWCVNEAAALKKERELIHKYKPRYNDQHNRSNPLRVDWRQWKRQDDPTVDPEPTNAELASRQNVVSLRRRPKPPKPQPSVPEAYRSASGHGHYGAE